MMAERDLSPLTTAPSIEVRPGLDQRCHPQLHMTNDAWKVDEPDVNLKGEWKICIEPWIQAARRWTLCSVSNARPTPFQQRFAGTAYSGTTGVNVDKNAAYPPALNKLKQEGALSEDAELRPVKYLNHMLEPDHRRLKRLVKPG